MSTTSLGTAQHIVAKALALANEKQAPIAVVVTDRAGIIIAAARTDTAAPIAVELARRKASLSAATGTPTHLIVMIGKTDPILEAGVRSVADHLALPGGMPIIGPGGIPEGAVGVAGGHYSVDQEIVEAAVRPS
jgi:glc operon protein GlcG